MPSGRISPGNQTPFLHVLLECGTLLQGRSQRPGSEPLCSQILKDLRKLKVLWLVFINFGLDIRTKTSKLFEKIFINESPLHGNTNYFFLRSNSFKKKKIGKVFHIFAYLFHVSLNGRWLDSQISFCSQSVLIGSFGWCLWRRLDLTQLRSWKIVYILFLIVYQNLTGGNLRFLFSFAF